MIDFNPEAVRLECLKQAVETMKSINHAPDAAAYVLTTAARYEAWVATGQPEPTADAPDESE